jgi:hypothetical protein
MATDPRYLIFAAVATGATDIHQYGEPEIIAKPKRSRKKNGEPTKIS